uniref:Uncharacterized protein n=2 Tax=Meloidogyne incognita group TaxID=654580 RepID=A0A914NJ02_MELIC
MKRLQHNDSDEDSDGQKRIKEASRDGSRSRTRKRLSERVKATTQSRQPLQDITFGGRERKRRRVSKNRTSTLSRSPLERESSVDSGRSRGCGRKQRKNLRKDARSPLRERIDPDRGKSTRGDHRSNTSARSLHISTTKDGKDREREQVFYNFFGEDRPVVKITIPKVAPPSNKKIQIRPQTHIDDAVDALDKGNGSRAAECLWKAGALQLKNFCIKNGFDTFSHAGNKGVVAFLDRKFPSENIALNWNNLAGCHKSSHENSMELDEIHVHLETARLFCNSIFKIYNRGPIKYNDVVRNRPYLAKQIVEIKRPKKVAEYVLADEIVATRYDKVCFINELKLYRQMTFVMTKLDLSLNQTIELNDKKKTYDVKVRGREEVLLAMDGSFKLTFKFKKESRDTSWFVYFYPFIALTNA